MEDKLHSQANAYIGSKGWMIVTFSGSIGPARSYEVEVRPPTLPKLLTLQCVRAVTALLHHRCTASSVGGGVLVIYRKNWLKTKQLSFNMNALVEKHQGMKNSLRSRGKGIYDLTYHSFCDLKPLFIQFVLVHISGRIGWAARCILDRCCQRCLCTKGSLTKLYMGYCLCSKSCNFLLALDT